MSKQSKTLLPSSGKNEHRFRYRTDTKNFKQQQQQQQQQQYRKTFVSPGNLHYWLLTVITEELKNASQLKEGQGYKANKQRHTNKRTRRLQMSLRKF